MARRGRGREAASASAEAVRRGGRPARTLATAKVPRRQQRPQGGRLGACASSSSDSIKEHDRWKWARPSLTSHGTHCRESAGVRNTPTVDESETPTLAALTTEIQDVALQVHQAQERA